MTKEQYLLICLAEECGELAQRATKALRFGLDETREGHEHNNTMKLLMELADVHVILGKLDNVLSDNLTKESATILYNYTIDKKTRFDKYFQLSVDRGIVKE